MKYVVPNKDGFERIVFAEVLVPDTVNVAGDFHTKQSIRDFAYGFMISGFDIDINHNGVNRSDHIKVVESFIAREGDKDFIEGAWVVGMFVGADDVWQDILDGKLNGYSYEALVKSKEIEVVVPTVNYRYGETEEDPVDGHTHQFFVLLDSNGRVVQGSTTENCGHSHEIVCNAVTGSAFGHCHNFNYLKGKDGL